LYSARHDVFATKPDFQQRQRNALRDKMPTLVTSRCQRNVTAVHACNFRGRRRDLSGFDLIYRLSAPNICKKG
jgi:hypothetical protein